MSWCTCSRKRCASTTISSVCGATRPVGAPPPNRRRGHTPARSRARNALLEFTLSTRSVYRWREPLAHCAGALLDWMLPRACPGCDAVPLPASALCASCRGRIVWSAAGEVLRVAPELIERGTAGAWYEGAVEIWLRRFKYPGTGILALQPGSALVAGELIETALESLASAAPTALESLDAVIPVPSPVERIRERGFHPAGLLARVAGAALARPVAPRVLRAAGLRPSQTGLSRRARRRNVAGAFELGHARVRGTSFLLVDDVVTTGATLESAASALRRGGAKRVLAVCAAQARAIRPTVA